MLEVKLHRLGPIIWASCPECRWGWYESPRTLYNVNALPCEHCNTMLAVRDEDFSGDANAAPQDE